MSSRFLTKLVATVAFAAASLPIGAAQAQERHNPLEGQPPVRHKKELREGRFFVGPFTGVSLLGDYKNTYLVGGEGEYYINDWLSIGAMGATGFNQNTQLTNRLAGTLPCTYAPNTMGCPSLTDAGGNFANFDRATPLVSEFYQHMNQISWVADLHGGYTPAYGKIALFGALFADYDLEFTGGLGFVGFTNGFDLNGLAKDPRETLMTSGGTLVMNPINQNPQSSGTEIGPSLGVSLHFFINDWIALDLTFKDFIVNDNPGGFDINRDRSVGSDDKTLQNKIFANLGLTFYFPPTPEISE